MDSALTIQLLLISWLMCVHSRRTLLGSFYMNRRDAKFGEKPTNEEFVWSSGKAEINTEQEISITSTDYRATTSIGSTEEPYSNMATSVLTPQEQTTNVTLNYNASSSLNSTSWISKMLVDITTVPPVQIFNRPITWIDNATAPNITSFDEQAKTLFGSSISLPPEGKPVNNTSLTSSVIWPPATTTGITNSSTIQVQDPQIATFTSNEPVSLPPEDKSRISTTWTANTIFAPEATPGSIGITVNTTPEFEDEDNTFIGKTSFLPIGKSSINTSWIVNATLPPEITLNRLNTTPIIMPDAQATMLISNALLQPTDKSRINAERFDNVTALSEAMPAITVNNTMVTVLHPQITTFTMPAITLLSEDKPSINTTRDNVVNNDNITPLPETTPVTTISIMTPDVPANSDTSLSPEDKSSINTTRILNGEYPSEITPDITINATTSNLQDNTLISNISVPEGKSSINATWIVNSTSQFEIGPQIATIFTTSGLQDKPSNSGNFLPPEEESSMDTTLMWNATSPPETTPIITNSVTTSGSPTATFIISTSSLQDENRSLNSSWEENTKSPPKVTTFLTRLIGSATSSSETTASSVPDSWSKWNSSTVAVPEATFDFNSSAPLMSQCGLRPIRQKIPNVRGGFVVDHGAFPWMAQILHRIPPEEDWAHGCGGTILNHKWILTAAHCLKFFAWRKTSHDYLVAVGNVISGAVNESEQEFEVEELIISDIYSGVTLDGDLALVKIHPNDKGDLIKFSDHVQPACLPLKIPSSSQLSEAGYECLIAGWGLKGAERVAETNLRGGIVRIAAEKKCRESEPYKHLMTDNMICDDGSISPRDGGGKACKGDSGGGLVCDIDGSYTVLGVVSWIRHLCSTPGPSLDVYAKVGRFTDWIQAAIAE